MAGSIYRACQNYNSFRELFHWAMVEFETASGVTNFPVNKKGGYYATKFISNNIFCSQQINLSMQWCKGVILINMMKMDILWKGGRKNIMLRR